MGTELMKHTEREVSQEQGSKFKFTGYEVSVEDFGCTYWTFCLLHYIYLITLESSYFAG